MTAINHPSPARDVAMRAVFWISALGFLDSIFNYFYTGNGIHGSEGALLVIVSTLLMAIAALLIGNGWIRGWLRAVFEILLVLDFLGTGLAAYFLDAWLLLGLVVLAAVAWLAHVFRPTTSSRIIG